MRTLEGTIVSNKMTRTVVVRVDRLRQHPKYRKFYRISKKYKAHVDDSAAYHLGDVVEIAESRPYSKEKRWKVTGLVRRSESAKNEASEEDQAVIPDTQNGIASHSTENV